MSSPSSPSSNGSANSNTYDPTDDAVDTFITGLLPLLLVVLYKGFENDKKKTFSPINIFDDFIIFSSIIIFPVITGVQWYAYYSAPNKILFITQYAFMIFGGFILYVGYYVFFFHYNGRNVGRLSQGFIYCMSISLAFSSWLGYSTFIAGNFSRSNTDYINYVSDYCKEKFTYNKCNGLRISNHITYGTCIGVSFASLSLWAARMYCSWNNWDKLKNFLGKFNTLGTISNQLVMIILIIYPAIISGWLLSTNSLTTKIAFGICSISLSRLVEHFNDDKLEKINTIISCYLNQHRDIDKEDSAEQMEEPTETESPTNGIKEKTKERTDKIKRQTEKIKEKTKEIEEHTKNIEKELEEMEKPTKEEHSETEEEQTESTIEIHDEELKQ